jgi:hypothetical protein
MRTGVRTTFPAFKMDCVYGNRRKPLPNQRFDGVHATKKITQFVPDDDLLWPKIVSQEIASTGPLALTV